jgi:hypothetical protein
MDLNRDTDMRGLETNAFDRAIYEEDSGRSNFASFLIGGVVVAGGLLAFLFYDGGALTSRAVNDGSSFSQTQMPAAPAAPSINAPGAPTNQPAR